MSISQFSEPQDTSQRKPVISIASKEAVVVEMMTALLPIVSDTEIMGTQSKPPVMLIEELIEEGSSTMIDGSWGSGKTAIAMEVAIACAAGLPFAGQLACARKRKVLFLALEAPRYQYEKQYWRLLKGHGLDTGIGIDFVFLKKADLMEESHAILLEQFVRSGRYEVVVLDTLRAEIGRASCRESV